MIARTPSNFGDAISGKVRFSTGPQSTANIGLCIEPCGLAFGAHGRLWCLRCAGVDRFNDMRPPTSHSGLAIVSVRPKAIMRPPPMLP
jgi:hypothetical protein